MNTVEMLDELQRRALNDEELRQELLATQTENYPVQAFCKVAQKHGYELYPMEVVVAGEEFYATMRRSTNGGGENAPLLKGEDDFYEMFMAGITKLGQDQY